MFKFVIFLLVTLFLVTMVGCTASIGQVVKNVYFDHEGNLAVEKCHVSINQFTIALSSDNCTTEKHKVPGR